VTQSALRDRNDSVTVFLVAIFVFLSLSCLQNDI